MEYPHPLDWLSISKPLAATSLLVVLWAAESVAPLYLQRRGRVRHGIRNLALGLVNTLAVAVPFASVMLVVTRWAEHRAIGIGHGLIGPVWLRWLVVLVLFDVGKSIGGPPVRVPDPIAGRHARMDTRPVTRTRAARAG